MASIVDDAASAGVFGVEMILPAQFWPAATGRGRGEPERRLMVAVLQDALLTLVAHDRRGSPRSRSVVEEIARWIASDSRAHPFAFAAICDVLGLDVSYVRAAIRGLQKSPSSYRRDYAGRGRHQLERVARSR